MLSASDHATNIFQTVSDTISELIKMPPDLSFLCSEGKMVHSHKFLVMVFSPVFRSMLSSVESNWSISSVVSFPDVSSSVLEQALHLLISRWDVVTMNDDLENAFNALGIYIKNVLVTENANNSACEEQNNSNKIIEESLTCNHCDEIFDKTSEDVKTKVAIHVGEFHLENEAQDEQLKLFPAQKCKSCGQKFHRKEARKLHTITKHPWQNLKSNIDNILKNDKINVGAKNRSQEKHLRSPIINNSLSVDVPKVDCIEAAKEKGLKKAQCTMCEKKWKQDAATNIYALRARIKNHVCKNHFEADMAVLLTDNFKGNSCKRCKATVITEADQKKHLQNNHGIFDDVIKPMLEDILGSTNNKRKRKVRKATSSKKILKSSERKSMNDLERMLSSPKKTSSEPQPLEETSEFKELQSCIEYSDSDDDDSDYEDLNEIQSNIDYSDSSDED